MALPTQHDDFPAWYQEVVRQADLAENSLARGTMVIKPYGYAIWEAIRDALDIAVQGDRAREPLLPDVHPARGCSSARRSTSRGSRPRSRW